MKDFHKEAHKYIGVPFRHRGRTTRGLDCVGLLILCAIDCGYDKYKEFAYGREPRNSILEGVLSDHLGEPINRAPKINAVVLMRLRKGGEPSHVGIITTHPHGLGIIHAHGAVERVVYQRLTEYMATGIAGVYSWQEKS